MSERTKTKDLINEVKSIVDLTKSLRVIVDALPDSSVKDAFEYSTENLEKKCEKFLNVSESLTEEQKKAIALIKQGKIDISKILPTEQNPRKPVEKKSKAH